VKAEWSTAGFNVCPICDSNEGREFTLGNIRGLIPAHPNCRCVAIPIVPRRKRVRVKPPKRRGKSGSYVSAEIRTDKDISSFFKGITEGDKAISFSDPMLAKLVKRQKFDGLPQKISRSEFNILKKSKTNVVMYRGVTEEKFKEAFIKGKYFSGTGVHGNGSYFTRSFSEAKAYGSAKSNNVITSILDKRAKGISRVQVKESIVAADKRIGNSVNSVFKQVADGELTEIEGERLLKQLSLNRTVIADEGRMTTMLGYDYMTVEAELNHIVVVNRTALRVVEEVIK